MGKARACRRGLLAFLKAEVSDGNCNRRKRINAAVTFGTHRLAHQSLCVNGLAWMADGSGGGGARGPGMDLPRGLSTTMALWLSSTTRVIVPHWDCLSRSPPSPVPSSSLILLHEVTRTTWTSHRSLLSLLFPNMIVILYFSI